MRIRKTVQAVIVDNDKILLVKKLDLQKPMQRWRLLKGEIEEGETEEQALSREIREEVGLKNIRIVKKISEYSFIFDDTKHEVSAYLVNASSNERLIIGTREINDAVWVFKKDVLNLLYWEGERQAVKLLR